MSYDPLQDLGWFTYVLTAILYSIFVFVQAPSSKADCFTKQNASHRPAILSIHIIFLAAILGMTRAAAHFYWFLPNWSTTIWLWVPSIDISFLTILFVLVIIVMYFAERKWISGVLEGDGVINHLGTTSED